VKLPRIARRAWRRRSLWLRLALVAVAPLLCLNLAVGYFGNTLLFPLSPFFLREKAQALARYARHRPRCLLGSDPPIAPLLGAAERRHALPPGLLAALVEVESKTRAHRISPAGAMGPGQLTAATAALLGVEDPFDPETAVDASARYLARHLRRFGDFRLALAAYNAGPGAVADGRVPVNGETEHYVVKVAAEYERRRPKTLGGRAAQGERRGPPSRAPSGR
jgi:soluble lytic murein transglycosylase-like protein